MKFSIPDYHSIFDLNEIMSRVEYRQGCILWRGTYSSKKVPIYIIRFDGQLISCKVLDILSAMLADRFVKKGDKKCRTKHCINPMHYL